MESRETKVEKAKKEIESSLSNQKKVLFAKKKVKDSLKMEIYHSCFIQTKEKIVIELFEHFSKKEENKSEENKNCGEIKKLILSEKSNIASLRRFIHYGPEKLVAEGEWSVIMSKISELLVLYRKEAEFNEELSTTIQDIQRNKHLQSKNEKKREQTFLQYKNAATYEEVVELRDKLSSLENEIIEDKKEIHQLEEKLKMIKAEYIEERKQNPILLIFIGCHKDEDFDFLINSSPFCVKLNNQEANDLLGIIKMEEDSLRKIANAIEEIGKTQFSSILEKELEEIHKFTNFTFSSKEKYYMEYLEDYKQTKDKFNKIEEKKEHFYQKLELIQK